MCCVFYVRWLQGGFSVCVVCVCVCSTMQTDVKFIKLHFQLTEAPERSQKKSDRTVQKIQSLVRSSRFRLVNNKNAMLFRFHFGQTVAMAKHAKLCTSDEPASALCAWSQLQTITHAHGRHHRARSIELQPKQPEVYAILIYSYCLVMDFLHVLFAALYGQCNEPVVGK